MYNVMLIKNESTAEPLRILCIDHAVIVLHMQALISDYSSVMKFIKFEKTRIFSGLFKIKFEFFQNEIKPRKLSGFFKIKLEKSGFFELLVHCLL